MTIDPDKYVVFKREEWDRFVSLLNGDGVTIDEDTLHSCDDAMVIRKKDIFAPPALYAYANAISTTIEIGRRMDAFTSKEIEEMQNLADHFAAQADQSQHYHMRRIPTQ